MSGKGDGRYKDRQQCSDEAMEIRWQLAFGKLSANERKKLEAKLK